MTPISKIFDGGKNRVAVLDLKISSQYVKKAGPLTVGPLQIPIDGNLYSTDTLTINVAPKLPEGIINGIWVRMIKFEGVNYIIFEQRQPGEFKEKTNERGRTSHSIGEEGAEWSDIHMDKIERLGIEIERKRTWTSVEFLEAGNALYRQVVYTYKPLPSFQGQLILDNSFIWKPPARCFIDIAR